MCTFYGICNVIYKRYILVIKLHFDQSDHVKHISPHFYLLISSLSADSVSYSTVLQVTGCKNLVTLIFT